jgi:TPR repeat protein
MYAQGRGVMQDDAQAVDWFKRAAAQGHASAQFNLGLMYEQGRGVMQDFMRAYMWFSLAAAKGNSSAIKFRDQAAGKMTQDQIVEAQKLARG